MNNNSIRIFISYAHKDESYKDELMVHLSPMRRQNLIETWDDREILPGQLWNDNIKGAIENAQIILLLISPDFMNSNYINDVEISRALERHKRKEVTVIPIVIRPIADFHDFEVAKFQALPKNAQPISTWDNKDMAWVDVATQLKGLITRMRTEKPSPAATSSSSPQSSSNENSGPDLSEIKMMIAQGKTKKAIEALMELTKTSDPDMYNGFLLQLSRFNSLERDSRMGIITAQDKSMRINQINYSVLAMIEDME